MTLKIRKNLMDKVLNGSKKSTSRIGERDFQVGDTIIFVSLEDESITYSTEITDVTFCKACDFTLEEAMLEGYDSVEEMLSSLAAVYNFELNQIFTLIRFK